MTLILPGLDLFLKRYCEKKQKENFKRLTEFRLYLEQAGLGDIKDLKTLHVTQYLIESVNQKQIRRKSKEKYLQLIRQYFKFACDNELLHTIKVGSMKDCNFSDFISPKIANRLEMPYPTQEDIKLLIRHARKVSLKMYVYLVLLSHNGMRDSEILSTQLAKINFDTRLILTGLIPGHMKESECYYFIPRKFIGDLRRYVEKLRQKYNDPKFLFLADTETGFMDRANIERNLRKYKRLLGLKCRVNPHVFRHALNYERLRMGCDDALRAILLNQKPKGSNGEFYLKMVQGRPDIRLEFWDKFTPEYL